MGFNNRVTSEVGEGQSIKIQRLKFNYCDDPNIMKRATKSENGEKRGKK